jgi:predicted permease
MRPQDLAVGLRSLARRPGFAATAILLLALGAGANAAVFSIVRGVLLKPLPYRAPEQLVALWPGTFVSNQELDFWRARTRSFDQIAAISPGWLMSLVVDGLEPLDITGGKVSDTFFTTLGVPAALGRTVLPGDAAPARAKILVLGWPLYERHFGADPRTIGRRVVVDGVEHEIVGVMPRGFEFREPGTDAWSPLPADPTSSQHTAGFSLAFARLNEGVTAEHATVEIRSLLPGMRADLGKPTGYGADMHAASLHTTVVGGARPTLLILLVAVGFVLLLAAVNLGTLVLGRSLERAREMAVRTALGASRGRLVRQLVAEQAVLAAAGALAGLATARIALPVLARLVPPDTPRQAEIALDAVVFFVVLAVSVAVSVLVALVPVVIAARPEIQPLLRQSRSTETPARRRALGALVAAEVALAVVLGIGAGLMLRSLLNLQRVDPGFDTARVLTFRLQTTSRYRRLADGLPYFEQVLDRVRALPGVTHVGSIQHLPMTGYNWTTNLHRVEDPPAAGAAMPTAVWRFIGWDYFAAMGIAVRAGRTFTAHDHEGSVPVAIVNEALARREFGSPTAALGRRLVTYAGRSSVTVDVIGVVADVRFESLDRPASPEIYRPLAQTFMFPSSFVVRTDGHPAQLAAAVRQAAYTVDPTVPVADLQTLASVMASTLGRSRLLAMLLSAFAAVGLLLGVVGVYGVVACRVRQQEREIGIRLALGARPELLAVRVLGQGIAYAACGLAAGLPAAWVLTRLMESVVFGVTAHDPLTFTGLSAAIVAATVAACLMPASRAARLDPVRTLRSE